MTKIKRQPSAIDEIAERYVDRVVALSPILATHLGRPGHDAELDDLSPAGLEAAADLDRATLAELDAAEKAAAPGELDDVDRVTLAAMRERLGLASELHEAGEDLRSLNSIASPLQMLRDVFDMMPTDTTEAWQNIATRMAALPTAMDGYIASLRAAAAKGDVAAIRQVREAIKQAREQAGDESFFVGLAAGAPEDLVDDALAADLRSGVARARASYATLADFLEQELLPQAPEQDAVGRERYARLSRDFLGAEVDLDETYQWGLEELARIDAEQKKIAEQIAGPGATIEQAVEILNADPKYQLHGKEELLGWMQSTADQAINDLAGTHFDIDGPLRTLEAHISPTQSGSIYYTPPTEDFSRPGRMWWTVPEGVDDFSTWQEKTTVYHEGVPGHHLQVAGDIANKDNLNSWRRLLSFTSGHGEGWALYAEQLMADLGYLDDPGERLGMLDGQRLRAARVVIDIGFHLGLPAPAEWGGKPWTPETAWDFLRANVKMNDGLLHSEYLRYLGWPGQAPAYKIGQRLWEQARDEAKAAAEARGEEFDLRDFHRRALGIGSVGLDVLRDELRRQDGISPAAPAA